MSSLLQGGDMRRKRGRGRRRPPRRRGRRSRRGLGIGVVALAVLVAVGVWLFSGIGGSSKRGQDVLTTPQMRTHKASPKRPLYEGPPGIQLVGGPRIDVNFKASPRGGLLFDVNTGQV